MIGETPLESRFEAHQTGSLTPIFGREQELQLMQECWAGVMSGTGHMILVSGEAGIGKSRVARALIDEIEVDDHTRLTFQCSPYHSDSAFYPIIAHILLAARIESTDNNDTRLDKLEKVNGVDSENAALLAAMLGVDSSARYGSLDLTPAQQRAQTMQALCQIIVRLSQDKPLLFVFEDLHWIDPTSLELLDIALDAIVDEKILILATARPTFEHGFGGHPSMTRYALNRLGREQIRAIVEQLSGGRAMPEEVLKLIVNRTDGVPLFVEELTRAVLETGVLIEQSGRYVLDGPLDSLAIPSSLHDSLMARLDRLQPIKTVAQTAACIGREFNYSLLASISPQSETELIAALEGLIKSELVYRRGVAQEARYLFKHSLVRDAAYASLLKENRCSIHNRILDHMEKESNTTPEVLAWHAEAAGLTDRSIDLWEAASKIAVARPAFDEAISHLLHAIELLSPQISVGTQAVLERALGLQLQLGAVRLYRNGYGADETKEAFEHALFLADKIGETPLRVPVLYGLWVNKYLRAQHADALLLAQAILELVEGGTDTAPIMLANRLNGVSLSLQGTVRRSTTLP